LFSYGANRKQRNHDKDKAEMMGLTLQSNLHGNNKMKTTHSDVAQNGCATKIKTNTTALWIIIDLPSYFVIL
jgi:hypothetical protein